MGIRGIWVCVCLTALADVRSQSLTKCAKVREAFQLRQLGAAKAAPDTSSAGNPTQRTNTRSLTDLTASAFVHLAREPLDHTASCRVTAMPELPSLAGSEECVGEDGRRSRSCERVSFISVHASRSGRGAAGPDLQMTSSTCRSHNLTCCTKKMEERVPGGGPAGLPEPSAEVLLRPQALPQPQCGCFPRTVCEGTNHLALAIRECLTCLVMEKAVEVLVHQVQNHTLSLLQSAYGDLAERMLPPVSELFADVELFVLGAELSPEEAVQRFFHSLFPLVLQQLVEPGLAPLDPAYAECARTAAMGRRGPGAFGPAPGLLAARVGGASLPARLFLQALHLGVEVVNTTARPTLARECRRALLRMAYCPRCQALPARPPCTGYCLNVLRGCLASLAEVDAPWREFVRSLEELGSPPRAGLDLGQALGDTTALFRDAVAHMRASAPWLSAQVRSVCGLPRREPAHARIIQQGSGMRDPSLPLRRPTTRTDDTLGIRTRELLQGLRVYRTFYGGLADQMCVSELASADTITCWNGADMVRRATLCFLMAVSCIRYRVVLVLGIDTQPLSLHELLFSRQYSPLMAEGAVSIPHAPKSLVTPAGALFWGDPLSSLAQEPQERSAESVCVCVFLAHTLCSHYTQRVTGNGVQAQSDNPEVRVKEVDPIINQVIDKLKHINQLLQGRTIPRLGTLDRIEVGSGDMVAPYSGDCDDEDRCWGSGNGVSDSPAAPKPEEIAVTFGLEL
ncbi:hypothetical protein P4O66_021192 [Electrophorus voltai]|uniref:Glypican 5c n=1 Tax=Electrophorus voltai TaxID=2609070 RepID=A0AAD9E376_9TELE|nr:hypothetical protein P4O66_021192 [Electrophorus voltai]